MSKLKLQKQSVPFETRLYQSLVIGAELMMLYALVVLIFGSNEPFEHLQTRGFSLTLLPTLVTVTIYAFHAALREHRTSS